MPQNSHGKISYVEIPAADIGRSSAFYESLFGWKLRTRGDGSLAFDDGVEVSGTWVTGRNPSTSPGLLTYIMVDSVAEILDKVPAAGGEVEAPAATVGAMTIARVRDPAGNVWGIFQER